MTVVPLVPQTSLLDWDFLMTGHKPKRSFKVISFFANVGAAAVSDPAWRATHGENQRQLMSAAIGQWSEVGAWPLWQHRYL